MSTRTNIPEIFGQYAVDSAEGRVRRDPYGTLDARGDGDPGFHGEDVLFDGRDGLIDEATGEAIQEPPEATQHHAGETVRIVPEGLALRGLAKTAADKAANEWMEKQDYNW